MKQIPSSFLFLREEAVLRGLCRKMFPRSLWVYHANSGGCNGCDIEVLNVLTPYYDVERFGIRLVGSPVTRT